MLPGTFLLFLIYATVGETRWSSFTNELNNNTNNTEIVPSAIASPAHSTWSHGADNRNESSLEDINNENNEDTLRNKEDEDANNGPLLVGFGGDPFKYSIPEEDYLKGVRSINPKTHTNKTENRGKRSTVQLHNIIGCASDCNAVDYASYGCYCGIGGFGTPVDAIDECCKELGSCYDSISHPNFTWYYWHCTSDGPVCSWKNNWEASRVCECDQKLAMCLKNLNCPRRKKMCFCSPFCWLGENYWSD